MTKEQYAAMLADINETNKIGGDVSVCIAKYRKKYKYIYIYNDSIFKMLFGNPENERMTVDFLNAVLNLYGSDCIDHLTFANPAVPSAFSKDITSDIVALDENQDRIVLEVQHVNDGTFTDRLVFYTAKHTVASRVKGDDYNLRNLNLVSLQMFNGFPESDNYRHHVRLKNQENEEFYKKQTITLVEIPKFLTGNYNSDNSMLAQWLRVIDGLNTEHPVPVPEGSMFALLHKKAKLCIFTEEFLVSEAKNMGDRNYEMYVERKHARAEGLAEGKKEGKVEMARQLKAMGDPIEKIALVSGLSIEEIKAL